MPDLETYYKARAAEEARLAEIAKNDGARDAHRRFAEAYRQRLTEVCASRHQTSAR